MDDSEKKFLTEKFDGIGTRMKGIENELHHIKDHQKKTCDELDDVKKEATNTKVAVARIDERIGNHLESVRKRDVTARERVFMVIGIVSACVAVLTLFGSFN